MKTDDIKKMGLAYVQVLEASKKSLDPVDQDELKGTHAQRKDKDIDNDGDADSTDKYLHTRRKAVSKAIKGKEVETVEAKMTDKQMKDALASAKAKAKPKDQVSLSKTPWDNMKEEHSRSTWPILNRIMERRTKYVVEPENQTVEWEYAKDSKEDHLKGSTKPEEIDSKASAGEKDFVAKHGGLDGNKSNIDGAKAAEITAKAAVAGIKRATMRPSDQTIGDKAPLKPKM